MGEGGAVVEAREEGRDEDMFEAVFVEGGLKLYDSEAYGPEVDGSRNETLVEMGEFGAYGRNGKTVFKNPLNILSSLFLCSRHLSCKSLFS